MALTKQQLLIPRVLCIGTKEGEPNDTSGEFKSGQIITVGSLVQLGLQLFTASELLLGKLCTDYPNCFKPLPWWEKIDESELPDLVWQKEDIYRVDKYDLKRGYVWLVPPEFGHSVPVELDITTPADESDFQEYQKQKQ